MAIATPVSSSPSYVTPPEQFLTEHNEHDKSVFEGEGDVPWTSSSEGREENVLCAVVMKS